MAEPEDRLPDRHLKAVGKNRRTSPRLQPSAIPSLKRAELLDGPEARLLNVSRGGALIETAARMMPGAIVCLRLVAADAVFLLRGRVLRSRATLLRDSTLFYESAVAFDEDFPLPVHDVGESPAEKPATVPALEDGSVAGEAVGRAASPEELPPATYTITASVPRTGPDLHQIFGLNRW